VRRSRKRHLHSGQLVRTDGGRLIAHREPASRRLTAARVRPFRPDPEPGPITEWEWENNHYYGLLRRFPDGFPIGGGPFAILSISALDDSARHDWREYQQIKNDLLGPEWEGLELYPSESRLKDPSNRFYLWCVPPGVIPWGLGGGRLVLGPGQAQAPQRPFPE